jgi:lysozyme
MNDLTPLINLIKHFEGCHLEPYLCPAGVWTCGWGSTGADVVPGVAWTQEYADARLDSDVLRFSRQVRKLLPGLNPLQHCAITDFAYNLGVGALRSSTLRKRILAGRYDDVPYQLSRWVYGGGKKLNGLVRRRVAEAELFTQQPQWVKVRR